MEHMGIKKCNDVLDMPFSLFRNEHKEQSAEELIQIKEEAKRRGWECCI